MALIVETSVAPGRAMVKELVFGADGVRLGMNDCLVQKNVVVVKEEKVVDVKVEGSSEAEPL